MEVFSLLLFSLMTKRAFSFDVDKVKQHMFRNGSCLLLGNYLNNNVTLDQRLFEDQVMILTTDIKELNEKLPIGTYITMEWEFLAGTLRTALLDQVKQFPAFIEDTVKLPLCSVLLLGPTGHSIQQPDFQVNMTSLIT